MFWETTRRVSGGVLMVGAFVLGVAPSGSHVKQWAGLACSVAGLVFIISMLAQRKVGDRSDVQVVRNRIHDLNYLEDGHHEGPDVHHDHSDSHD